MSRAVQVGHGRQRCARSRGRLSRCRCTVPTTLHLQLEQVATKPSELGEIRLRSAWATGHLSLLDAMRQECPATREWFSGMIRENQPVVLGAVVGDDDAVGAGDRTVPEDSGEVIVDSSGEAPAVTQVAESSASRENSCANAQGDLDFAGRSLRGCRKNGGMDHRSSICAELR